METVLIWSKDRVAQYLELLHLLLLLGLPLPDDAEHLAHHRLDPLRERLREGLPKEEGVEDGLALVVICATTPARAQNKAQARIGLPFCSSPHVGEVTWFRLRARAPAAAATPGRESGEPSEGRGGRATRG